MSPERAKICIINDHTRVVRSTLMFLEAYGHEVVLTASTLEEALSIIPHFKEQGIQVALVDGNLTQFDLSGQDGKKIVEVIKFYAPDVKTVGYSASGFVEGADVNFDAKKKPPEELINLINSL